MEIPEELSYTRDHEWAIIEGKTATVGITDYAQDSLGDIVFLELPEQGAHLKQGDIFGVVESVKAVSDLYAPVSGMVVEVNSELVDQPEMINEDPYGDGWMIKIETDDPSEFDKLLSAEDYQKMLEEEKG